jgi:predicted TPR repeat methyltransferase
MKAHMQQAGGDDSGAMISLQHAVILNPREFAAMTELAEMLEDYDDKPGALKLYRRVLVLDPQMKVAAERAKALSKEVEGQGI